MQIFFKRTYFSNWVHQISPHLDTPPTKIANRYFNTWQCLKNLAEASEGFLHPYTPQSSSSKISSDSRENMIFFDHVVEHIAFITVPKLWSGESTIHLKSCLNRDVLRRNAQVLVSLAWASRRRVTHKYDTYYKIGSLLTLASHTVESISARQRNDLFLLIPPFRLPNLNAPWTAGTHFLWA